VQGFVTTPSSHTNWAATEEDYREWRYRQSCHVHRGDEIEVDVSCRTIVGVNAARKLTTLFRVKTDHPRG
jgi:hypothetical protein